jgi:hypothetical protein
VREGMEEDRMGGMGFQRSRKKKKEEGRESGRK